MKLEHEEEEKKAREHKEEFEVRCNPQFFRQIIPTQSQKGNRRKDIEREKKEKEATERKERLKVHCEPYIFRQSTVLTPSQGVDSTLGGYIQWECSRLDHHQPF